MVDMVEALMGAFIQELDRRQPKEVQQMAENVWIEMQHQFPVKGVMTPVNWCH